MGLLSPTPSIAPPPTGGLLARSVPPVTPSTTQTSTPAMAQLPKAPIVPQTTPEQEATAKHSVLGDIFNAPDNSTLGIIKNTITGIPKALKSLATNLGTANVGAAFGNEKLNETPAGIEANTILGTPKAAVTLAPTIAHAVTRDVAGVVPTLEGKASIPVPDNNFSRLVYGTAPIPSLYENGKNYMIQNGTDPRVASVEGLPFGMMLAISDVWAGPEEDGIKAIAGASKPADIEKAITTHYPALTEQAPALSHVLADIKDPAQVSQIVKDAINKTVVDKSNAVRETPDITYEPEHEEGQTASLEKAAEIHNAPTPVVIPPEYKSLAELAKKSPDAQTFLNNVADHKDESLMRDLYNIKKNPIEGTVKTPQDFYDAATKNPVMSPEEEIANATGSALPSSDPDVIAKTEQLPPAQEPLTVKADTLSKTEPAAASKSLATDREPFDENSSYSASISENNGGVVPPENKGGVRPPEIDFTTGKDKIAPDLGINTMERNVENIFPRETADKINQFLVEPTRANETSRAAYVSDLRKYVKSEIVDKLGIHVGSKDSELLQRYGEGRMTLSELMKESKNADNVIKANSILRQVYDNLLDRWNEERAAHGIAPVTKRADYFRHFQDLKGWMHMFGITSKKSALPTSISGITESFRSRVPWASAAMRRIGGPFTEDALKGLDQYLDTTSRAIFHTDSVQRGRLFEKYMREVSQARIDKGLPDIKLPNFASNLNDWVNLVSGKQAKLDRAIESTVGRSVLQGLGHLIKWFGKNVIGGSVSAAVTHSLPLVYNLATVDTKAAVLGAMDTLRTPFTQDVRDVNGVRSDFLTRRFPEKTIEPTILDRASNGLGWVFHSVDQFISHMAVSSKYAEGISKGLTSEEAMKAADNYATRVIGDRTTGNLPNLMNTKTLGMFTQFQVEVNDNLQVLLHDIPRDQHGDAIKVAQQVGKFAVYSFLANQVFQQIKGSGKGLDPIDLGLTLAGVNAEGKGKDFPTRAGSALNDAAKELPFSSIVTQGQIPAFQPVEQAYTKATSGNIPGALEQLAVDYGSPIGGGVQLQKTIEGLSDVNKGQVTNSKGQLTSVVPKTPANYIKGALFGPSAFPDQATATQNETQLYNLLQKNKTGQQTVKAMQEYDKLKAIDSSQGSEAANTAYEAIKTSDPSLAKLILVQASNEKLGLTKEDLMVKQLGVGSGQRAQYLAQKFNTLPDATSKKALWEKYVADKIITPQVASQLIPLLKK